MPNLLYVLLAALVPTVVGFIWYNPKVFGTAWMKAASMTEEKIKSGNMGLIFTLSFVLSLMLSFMLYFAVVHQTQIFSLFMHDPDFQNQMAAESGPLYDQFMGLMGQFDGAFRTFGHGMVHGFGYALMIILPIMATNAMFERKGFKYILVNVGYWMITLMLMGGILCQWA